MVVIFLLNFYRTPEAQTHQFRSNDILCPSYGTIACVETSDDTVRIISYLSPTDVHMQYCPVAGTVVRSIYDRTGKFNIAYKLGKSRLNEKRIHSFSTEFGNIEVVQIAGFLTRRIDSWIAEGYKVSAGQPLGFIHLGSRVDIVLPRANLHLVVKKGDRLQGGRQRLGYYE